jgi:hypothetical protein
MILYDLSVVNLVGHLSKNVKIPLIKGFFPVMNHLTLTNKIPNLVQNNHFNTSKDSFI